MFDSRNYLINLREFASNHDLALLHYIEQIDKWTSHGEYLYDSIRNNIFTIYGFIEAYAELFLITEEQSRAFFDEIDFFADSVLDDYFS